MKIALLICILFAGFGVLKPSDLFSQQPEYEIFALKFGERTHKIPLSAIAVGATGTDSVQINFMFWLLKGNNGKVILVDAGFTSDADINPMNITFSRPDSMLSKIHIKPEDITDIIITHPHWDHIGGIDLYPNAMVWMQKEDYEYFVGQAWQKEGNSGGFNKKDVTKIVQRNLDGKLKLVNGDDIEIIPGIRVYTGSKHTFQSQYVLTGNGEKSIIIASDNCWFYYNLEKLLPIPVTHDSKAYTKNLKRMKSMVKNTDFILPGHDPQVFTKFLSVEEGVVLIKN